MRRTIPVKLLSGVTHATPETGEGIESTLCGIRLSRARIDNAEPQCKRCLKIIAKLIDGMD